MAKITQILLIKKARNDDGMFTYVFLMKKAGNDFTQILLIKKARNDDGMFTQILLIKKAKNYDGNVYLDFAD